MNRFIAAFVFGVTIVSSANGSDCSAPPVRSSGQAMCYATAYAEKNGLAHGPAFKSKTIKGKNAWTVSFVDTRPKAGGSGWQVDVDAASGTVTRFTAYKKPDR